MIVAPVRYLSDFMVLNTPTLLFSAALQVLIQTQSDKLMVLHLVVQAFGFYFYGMERMAATMRGMSVEDLIQSARATTIFTFAGDVVIVLCMRVFYSQFSSL